MGSKASMWVQHVAISPANRQNDSSNVHLLFAECMLCGVHSVYGYVVLYVGEGNVAIF